MKYLYHSGHQKFDFASLEELKEKINQLNKKLPFSDDYSKLFEQIKVEDRIIPNAIAVQPMEGCDGSAVGHPGDLTVRRYKRFAAGGSGLLWMEATAVKNRGRANPRQLTLRKETASEFKKMKAEVMKAAADSMGENHKPLLVVQLTHSGRYSKPRGYPEPIIAHHSQILDPKHDLPSDYELISDEELDELQEKYVEAASIAADMGYEAVDVKACHGYLVNELLAAHTRKNSKYGGSFANRTRFLTEVIKKIKAKNPDLMVTTRLNVYDAVPYPYGFGMAEDGSMKPDMTEPIKLIKKLYDLGVNMVNVATGNPYYNPHVERPFDTNVEGGYIPECHPLENIYENMIITREIQQAIPDDMITVSSGLSWLRQYVPVVGAGLRNENWCDIVGLGRVALAYPDWVKDLQEKGKLEPDKMCISCSSCTQMMRDGQKAGCPVRDSEIYGPIFREGRLTDPEYAAELAEECRNCAPATCKEGCPAEVDVPGFVQAIAAGEDENSYNILRNNNSLPEVCAYVCPVEAQCEGACVRNNIGRGPVPIQELQRYISRKARKEGFNAIEIPEETKEKVAVIGAGPAGLSCMVELLKKGYKVTVFDAEKEPGGMAEKVIPEDRMKSDILKKEVKSIIKNVPEDRIEWKFNSKLGKEIDLNSIYDNYSAVFLGTGLSDSIPLPVNGSRPEEVVDALTFLKKIKNNDYKLPATIAVIGGGNTAMDAASQAAKKAGETGDVYLVYRRSYSQMPAWKSEINTALERGVHFLVLQQPVEYVTDAEGKLKGIKIKRTRLGAVDESGRRKPEIVEGTEQLLKVDLVIEAVGQKLSDDLEKTLVDSGIKVENGLIQTGSASYRTARKGIFAGGDIINGGRTVVESVKDGKKSADEIVQYLS
ncbi:MAG: FAD-dependent oxidoreductase [bacterium]